MNPLTRAGTFISATCLIGCGTPPVKVADALASPEAHATSTFSPQALGPDNLKVLPPEISGSKFKRIIVQRHVTSKDSSGKEEVWQSKLTILPTTNGLSQQIDEVSTNGFIDGQLYSLTYRGLFDLMSQTVNARASQSQDLNRVRSISKFSRFDAKQGATWHIEASWGNTIQIAGFRDVARKCVSGATVPGTNYVSTLNVPVVEVECEAVLNGVVTAKYKVIVLPEYGVGIQVTGSNSRGSTSFRISSIDFQ